MHSSTAPDNPAGPFPFSQADWEHTPPAVQASLLGLQQHLAHLHQRLDHLQHQIDQLEGRLDTTSKTSSTPPSSDAPFTKRKGRRASGKRGARKGHPGSGPTLRTPTEVHVIEPPPCDCGHGEFVDVRPSYTHQVMELPPIELDIVHFVFHQGTCVGCGKTRKARVPRAHQAGYGPRLRALIGELAGMHRTPWRLLQDFCHSVLDLELSMGAVQKVIRRVSHAIEPHYKAMTTLAHQAPVGYIDETPWYCHNTLQWLWIMATDTVASSRIDPHRSKAAFFALIEDWQGILVSDDYGVYHDWVNQRQTCLAHLIRSARGVSQRRDPEIAACGHATLRELQRLCHMAHSPPTGGQWQAWYARLCRLIDRYHARRDDAGRLVRRLAREMASLWVFLREHGVEPTHNLAERGLRCGVMWRKTSHGTDSDDGNRWVERSLSLRHTCRQRGHSTFGVLVDALTSFFQGRQPDLAWLA